LIPHPHHIQAGQQWAGVGVLRGIQIRLEAAVFNLDLRLGSTRFESEEII
jgi:hypothetical protein